MKWVSPEEWASENPTAAHRAGYYIQPDIEPFVSPVDGRVITGRRALEAHNKRHNVTNVADFSDEWRETTRQRNAERAARVAREQRIDVLRYAFDKHRRGR